MSEEGGKGLREKGSSNCVAVLLRLLREEDRVDVREDTAGGDGLEERRGERRKTE